jgi:hypothetical protein
MTMGAHYNEIRRVALAKQERNRKAGLHGGVHFKA